MSGNQEFKGQFCTMSFGANPGTERWLARRNTSLDDLQIPRGGAYWMEDIMANLDPVCKIEIQIIRHVKFS